ncbi:MAG: hypothetical protein JXR83_08010 [Deltaproteobacteria bacterium]|nr:hypothetical protein [Deltaproteobacteria bacterium]
MPSDVKSSSVARKAELGAAVPDLMLRGAQVPTSIEAGRERTGISAKGQRALTDFVREIETRTQMTARDLFDPAVKPAAGSPLLKEIPADEMKEMALRLAERMPLCDLPGGDLIARGVSQLPGADRIQGDVSQLSYEELKKQLPDAAKQQLDEKFKPVFDDFKNNHKAAFYGLAVAGAVGVGALAYTQGSDLLTKLGIQPKLRRSFFDDRLVVKAEGEWEKKFQDPRLKLTAETHAGLGSNRLSLLTSVAGNARGLTTAKVEGRADLNNRPLGLDRLSISGSYTRDFTTDTDLTSFGVAGIKGSTVFSLTDDRNWRSGDSRTAVEMGTRLWGGTLSLYGAHINEGGHTDNQIGSVYRVRL